MTRARLRATVGEDRSEGKGDAKGDDKVGVRAVMVIRTRIRDNRIKLRVARAKKENDRK